MDLFEKNRAKRILCGWLLVLFLPLSACASVTEGAGDLFSLPSVTAPEETEAATSAEPVSGEETGRETQAGEIPPVSGETEAGLRVQPQEAYSFTNPSADTFARDSLNETQRLWYDDISETLGTMGEKKELSALGLEAGLDAAGIDLIFQCVLNDHPEYFYVEGYTFTKFTRGEEVVKIEFSGAYSLGMGEAKAREKRMESAVAALLEGIRPEDTDYDKVRYVYETLIRNTEYRLDAADNQNIYSVFVGGESVCQGYAKATQYLLNRLGMECTMVMGTVNTGEGHAWNLVKVDGSYYYVDTTWGDASYQMEESAEAAASPKPPEINYDYLCVTTAQLLRTHILGSVVAMPQCVALEANYYVREGVYFTSYDEEQLGRAFGAFAAQEREDITLKCADILVYLDMLKELITNQKIFDYLDGSGGAVSYAQNEKQLSLTFWMTSE
ncbi:MAG: hypothetical protein LBQ15_11275 [Clostridium sp.]|jgi:hypothetical protein|nr:hypothetical protein [Clostridium sp.]